jgi:hypothetical protein
MVPEDRRGVTEVAARFIEEHYLPTLEPALPSLMRLLERGGTLETRRKDPVFEALARVLPETFTPAEIEFYRHHLCFAGNGTNNANGRQKLFCRLLAEHTKLDGPFDRAEMKRLSEDAESEDEELSRRLQRIGHLEAFIAPAATLFDHVLTRNAQVPADVARHIREHWGPAVPNLDEAAFDDLLPEIKERFGAQIATVTHATHAALRTGEYERAIRSLIDWNARVMGARKAGPWVVLTPAGRIDVRYRGLEHLLPSQERLADFWINSYFVDSLKRLLNQLGNVA